jgi:segregation and condensation protein A
MAQSVSSNYRIELPAFTGPLDLLLHLIDRNELDITAISLARVTEQYLAQVEQLKQNRVDDLIDFLVIGARLVLIKSRALLPQVPTMLDEEEEEDPAEALARQLQQYKRFKSVANWLSEREALGLRTYLRVAPPPKLEGKVDLTGITVDMLAAGLRAALARGEQLEESVAVAVKRPIFTIDGQLRLVREHLRTAGRVVFGELLSKQITWSEISVTLLAILELIKRQEASANQAVLFGPIEIVALPVKDQPGSAAAGSGQSTGTSR